MSLDSLNNKHYIQAAPISSKMSLSIYNAVFQSDLLKLPRSQEEVAYYIGM